MARLQLPHGCTCSMPSVHPKNYNKPGADITKDWYIQYRFYDPSDKQYAKSGKLIINKGMNHYKDLPGRISATETILADELDLLQEQGWNPIKKCCVPVIRTLAESIRPDTPFPTALEYALPRIDCTDKYRRQIKLGLEHIAVAIKKLGLHRTPVQNIAVRDTSMVLEQVGLDKGGWSASNFNHHRTYLLILFNTIVPLANMNGNPIKNIKKKKEPKKLPVLLTREQRQTIHENLHRTNYRFWRYIHIFHASGGRSTELFALSDTDVDLANQRYKVMIKKNNYTEEWKPIKTVVLPLWEEIMREVAEIRKNNPDVKGRVLLFSTRLRPGIVPVNPETIGKKWRVQVKLRFGIESDFNKLKHLNATEIRESLGLSAAVAMNSHTSDKMVTRVYDINHKQREFELLKKADNKFA